MLDTLTGESGDSFKLALIEHIYPNYLVCHPWDVTYIFVVCHEVAGGEE
jgi:hypothetical protein